MRTIYRAAARNSYLPPLASRPPTMPTIDTARLLLIPASPESLRAELEEGDALARVLGVDVPPSWPPEHYDHDAVRWVLSAMEEGRASGGWSFYYVAERPAPGARAFLCGGGGFVGSPDDSGTVEIGYAVVPERRRRGYAREAVEAWVAWAFSHPEVRRVIAHTLPGLLPSIGVLESTGFTYVGPNAAAGEADAIQYERRRVP
jgi:ribosomal-protein-alanine N-acetyltransferase